MSMLMTKSFDKEQSYKGSVFQLPKPGKRYSKDVSPFILSRVTYALSSDTLVEARNSRSLHLKRSL